MTKTAKQQKPFIAEEFKKKAKLVHGDKFDYSNVFNAPHSAYLKVEIKCPMHGVFEQEAGNHLLKRGHGCRECAKEAVNKKLKKKIDVEEFIFSSKKIFGDSMFDYSLVKEDCYKNSRPIVTLICKIHGAFTVNAKDHLSQRGTRCKTCSKKESYGEFLVRRALEELSITFIQQKTFVECINEITGRKFFFDFYLPSHNTIIEFDGEYHFIPQMFGSRNHSIDEIQKRDELKNDFCKANNLRMLRIHFSNRNPADILNIIEREIINAN